MQAAKIVFSPANTTLRVATGVQFGTANGTIYTAFARREVIVSAGAIGVCHCTRFASHDPDCDRYMSFKSPALLQHSGVGDPTSLAKLGIQPQVNLPSVGLNVQEQVGTRLPPDDLLDRLTFTGSRSNRRAR